MEDPDKKNRREKLVQNRTACQKNSLKKNRQKTEQPAKIRKHCKKLSKVKKKHAKFRKDSEN